MNILDRSSSEFGAKIQKLKNLLETLQEIQTSKETQDVEETTTKILEIIKESGQIVQNSVYPGEMIMDAKILHSGTVFCNSNISLLNTNLVSFDEERYVNGILNYMLNSSETTRGNKWQILAPLTYHVFRKSEPITFMLGSITLKPVSTQEKKKIVRQKKTPQSEKMILESIAVKRKQEEEKSDFCEHLFMWLVKLYKQNDRKPINYFTFITDPLSFWRTIENIFYFAFLVRDGNVKMFIENGLPLIEPLLKKSTSQTTVTSNLQSQFCFKLSMSEWKKIIKKFHISSPSFPLLDSNKSAKKIKI